MINFFLFLNLTFCKKNNAKIIHLINFYVLIIILSFFVSNSNFTKQKRIYKYIYINIWTYFVYNQETR